MLDFREIAELTSDDEILRASELPEVPVSLEHPCHVDRQTRILVGYRLDGRPAESPRLRRRMALPPDPGIALHLDEVVFPNSNPERFWGALCGSPGARTAPDRWVLDDRRVRVQERQVEFGHGTKPGNRRGFTVSLDSAA